jgi:HD-GYP domain-containing protein (c-di-GMP phosphodiesterase class II)
MLVALMNAGYSMEDIMQMASELKKMDPHPADVQVAERKLSKAEEKEKEKVVKGMKKSKKDFEKRYGDDAESVMYATATKMAKEKKD